MYLIRSFLIAAAVAMLAAPVGAQGFNDSYDSFRRSLQDSYPRESVADILNRQQREMNRRDEQQRRQWEIDALRHENTRLRALRAQEFDRQRRRDPASGIWSPARSR